MASKDRRGGDRRHDAKKVGTDRRGQQRRQKSRRETERVPLELWMEESAGEDIYFRLSGNVSEGGVFFDRTIPHPHGTIVTLKFALPGEPEMVVARSKVVGTPRRSDGLGMGVKFINVEGDGAERIRSYIKRTN